MRGGTGEVDVSRDHTQLIPWDLSWRDDTVGKVTQKGLIEIYPPWIPDGSRLEGDEEEQRNVLLVKLCQCRQTPALLPGLLAEPTPQAPGISGK